MFGKYASFIIPSYAITLLVIAGLVFWVMAVYRARRREIERLEAAGITRSGGHPSRNTGKTS